MSPNAPRDSYLKHKPVLLILEKYPKLSEHDIIQEVACWFNAVGGAEFEDAKKSGLVIQTKDNPKLWELANKKNIE